MKSSFEKFYWRFELKKSISALSMVQLFWARLCTAMLYQSRHYSNVFLMSIITIVCVQTVTWPSSSALGEDYSAAAALLFVQFFFFFFFFICDEYIIRDTVLSLIVFEFLILSMLIQSPSCFSLLFFKQFNLNFSLKKRKNGEPVGFCIFFYFFFLNSCFYLFFCSFNLQSFLLFWIIM